MTDLFSQEALRASWVLHRPARQPPQCGEPGVQRGRTRYGAGPAKRVTRDRNDGQRSEAHRSSSRPPCSCPLDGEGNDKKEARKAHGPLTHSCPSLCFWYGCPGGVATSPSWSGVESIEEGVKQQTGAVPRRTVLTRERSDLMARVRVMAAQREKGAAGNAAPKERRQS